MVIVIAGWLAMACQETAFEEVATQAETMEAVSETQASIGSLTIIGENTEVRTGVDCKTCTFVVAKDASVVDGAALGLKAGSVICLESGVSYGDLTFVNLIGTSEQPIVIAQHTMMPE